MRYMAILIRVSYTLLSYCENPNFCKICIPNHNFQYIQTNFLFTTKLYINNNRAKLGLIPPDKLHVTIHLLPFKLAKKRT